MSLLFLPPIIVWYLPNSVLRQTCEHLQTNSSCFHFCEARLLSWNIVTGLFPFEVLSKGVEVLFALMGCDMRFDGCFTQHTAAFYFIVSDAD